MMKKKIWPINVDDRIITINRGTLTGVHWSYADPSLIVNRFFKNRNNINSTNNLEKNWSFQFNNINLKDKLLECKMHENDPKVI